MWYTLRTTTHKARKKHHDNGYDDVRDWAYNSWQYNELPLEEKERIRLLIDNPASRDILPGETYQCSFSVGDGDISVYKTRPCYAEIIHKYKLYHEE